ncbi:MAG: WD40/YVTN/BNR-like repeat-containing protein [Anaerolineae bacterium]
MATVLIAACGASPTPALMSPAHAPTSTPTAPQVAAAETPTYTPTTTLTFTPTTTPSPTATTPPTGTPTSTPVPTDTPNPTPSPSPTPSDTPTLTATPIPSCTAGKELGDMEVVRVAVDPLNSQNVYATLRGEGVYKSCDGGETWSLSFKSESVEGIAIDPVNPQRVYVGVWEGVLRTSDGGASWEVRGRQHGLPQGQTIRVLAVDPNGPETIYGGTGDGWPATGTRLVKSNDGGDSWTPWGMPQPEKEYAIDALAVDPTSGAIVYVGITATDRQGVDRGHEHSDVYKSFDGGASWTPLKIPTVVSPWVNSPFRNVHDLAIVPEEPEVVFAATSLGLLKSWDGGLTWLDITPLGPCSVSIAQPPEPIFAIAVDPHNDQVVYAGVRVLAPDNFWLHRSGLDKSVDGGFSWVTATNGFPRWNRGECGPVSTVGTNAIAIDPTNSQVIYAATTGGLFRSKDGGNSWGRR